MKQSQNVTTQMVLDLYDKLWEPPKSGEDDSDWIYEVLENCPIYKKKFDGDLPYKIDILTQDELNGIYIEFQNGIKELKKTRRLNK